MEIGTILLGHGRDGQIGIGQAHALAVRHAAGDLDAGDGAGLFRLDDAEAHLAVVDQDCVAGLQRVQDFGVGQAHARLIARCGIRIEDEGRALLELHAAVVEFAQTELGPLQIGENADGPAAIGLELAQHRHALAQLLVAAMAHVDAEDVDAGLKEGFDDRSLAGGGTEGRDDLDPAHASHEITCS